MKMKLGAILAGAVMMVAMGQASAAETKLLIGLASPSSSVQYTHGLKPWMERAAQLSNNTISFDIQAGGVTVTGTSALSAARNGVVDGAGIIASYFPTDLPVNGSVVSSLGFMGSDPRVTAGAVTELTLLNCPSCLKEYLDRRIIPFGPFATDPYSVLCRMPVTNLQDLKGKRVRVPGSAWGRLAQKWDMSAVNIQVSELYEALQRGTVDCNFTGITLMKSMSFGEVAKHVIEIPVGSLFSNGFMSLNTNTWKKLTPDQKKAIIRAAPVGVAGMAYGYLETNEVVKASAAANGYVIKQMDASMQASLEQFILSENESVMEAAKTRGVKDADQIIASFTQLNKKWEAIIKSIPPTREALEQALWDNIYSKFPDIK